MALNLWKLEGNALSYNPLPTGFLTTNRITSLPIGDYTVSFYAYSPTSKTMRVKLDSVSNLNVWTQALTPIRTLYKVTFNNKAAQTCYLIGLTSADNDIVVDSIVFNGKPLDKLTINGVDGFRSGKWTLHANATVVDDQTLTLNGTSNYQASRLLINNILAGQTYTLSRAATDNSYMYIQCQDSSGNVLGSYNTQSISLTFTTPANTSQVLFSWDNSTFIGSYTLSKPSLNLVLPAPYTPKTGDKMVIPTIASKNIVPDFDKWTLSTGVTINNGVVTFSAYGQTATSPMIPVKDSSVYVFSAEFFGSVAAPTSSANSDGTQAGRLLNAQYFDANRNPVVANSGYNSNGSAQAYPVGVWSSRVSNISNSTGSQVKYIQFKISADSAWTASSYQVRKPMAVLGGSSIATNISPFVDFKATLNKPPKRYLPKKNILDVSLAKSSQILDTTNNTIEGRWWASTVLDNAWINANLKPNTTYSISYNATINNYNNGNTSGVYDSSIGLLLYNTSSTSVDMGHFAIGSDIHAGRVISTTKTFTTPANLSGYSIIGYTYRFNDATNLDITYSNIQIELGPNVTSFEPYSQTVIPPSKKGMDFRGLEVTNSDSITTGYVIPSSWTKVALETEVYVRSNVSGWAAVMSMFWHALPSKGFNVIPFDNTTIKFCYGDGVNAYSFNTITVPGYYNRRVKLKVEYTNKTFNFYVDGVYVGNKTVSSNVPFDSNSPLVIGRWANSYDGYHLDGIVYNVKVYVDDVVTFNYDFEKSGTLAGSTFIPNAQNLVPNFEDSGWHFASGAKVIGKDIVHFDMLSIQIISYIDIPILPSTKYTAYMPLPTGTILKLQSIDANGTPISFKDNGDTIMTWTSRNDAVKLRYTFYNYPNAQAVDFVRPQLYLTDGQILGTVIGSPGYLTRKPKRVLYNKR